MICLADSSEQSIESVSQIDQETRDKNSRAVTFMYLKNNNKAITEFLDKMTSSFEPKQKDDTPDSEIYRH